MRLDPLAADVVPRKEAAGIFLGRSRFVDATRVASQAAAPVGLLAQLRTDATPEPGGNGVWAAVAGTLSKILCMKSDGPEAGRD